MKINPWESVQVWEGHDNSKENTKSTEEQGRQEWKMETQDMDIFERATHWWVKQLSPSGEWDNGDKDWTSKKVYELVENSRNRIPAEKITIFQETLIAELKKKMDLKKSNPNFYWPIKLQTDYGPLDTCLWEACRKSGISGMNNLPCKVVMEISPEEWTVKLYAGRWEEFL